MKAHRILGIVGVALLIGAGTASAQTVGGGAKFGMNFATITGDVGLEPAAGHLAEQQEHGEEVAGAAAGGAHRLVELAADGGRRHGHALVPGQEDPRTDYIGPQYPQTFLPLADR